MEGDTASGNPSPAMPEAAYVHSDEPMAGGDVATSSSKCHTAPDMVLAILQKLPYPKQV